MAVRKHLFQNVNINNISQFLLCPCTHIDKDIIIIIITIIIIIIIIIMFLQDFILFYFIRFTNYWQGHHNSMTPITAGP